MTWFKENYAVISRLLFAGEGEGDPPAGDPPPGEGDPPGGGGEPSDPPAWVAQLPEDLRGNELLTGHATIGDFATAFVDMNGKYTDLNGRVEEMVPKLGENPTEAELQAHREAYGIPANAEGYEFEEIQPKTDSDEDKAFVEQVKKITGEFSEVAHNLDLTPDQAAGLHNWYTQNILGAKDEMNKWSNEGIENGIAHLQQAWGDDVEKNMEIASRALWFFASSDEDLQFFDKSKLGDHPTMLRLFYRIGTQLMNDQMLRDVKPPKPDSVRKQGETGQAVLTYPSMQQE